MVNKIESNYTFVTVTKDEDGNWNKGQEVHIIEVNGTKYIRTDKNSDEDDNLGNLPEF